MKVRKLVVRKNLKSARKKHLKQTLDKIEQSKEKKFVLTKKMQKKIIDSVIKKIKERE